MNVERLSSCSDLQKKKIQPESQIYSIFHKEDACISA